MLALNPLSTKVCLQISWYLIRGYIKLMDADEAMSLEKIFSTGAQLSLKSDSGSFRSLIWGSEGAC